MRSGACALKTAIEVLRGRETEIKSVRPRKARRRAANARGGEVVSKDLCAAYRFDVSWASPQHGTSGQVRTGSFIASPTMKTRV
jgi:hypothetical protein